MNANDKDEYAFDWNFSRVGHFDFMLPFIEDSSFDIKFMF